METVSEWLSRELDRRGLSQADLVRLSGVTSAQVSRIISGSRGPGEGALRAIADALRLPAEQVFRAAGMLPPDPKKDPLTEEGLHILQQLEGENKEDAVRYLKLRLDVQEERGKYGARGKKRPATSG